MILSFDEQWPERSAGLQGGVEKRAAQPLLLAWRQWGSSKAGSELCAGCALSRRQAARVGPLMPVETESELTSPVMLGMPFGSLFPHP